MRILGDSLRRRGTSADSVEAARIYRRAAFGSNTDAMVRLGIMLLSPIGGSMAPDSIEGFAWLVAASRAQNPSAVAWVAFLQQHGLPGMPPDSLAAVATLRAGAATRDPIVLNNLAAALMLNGRSAADTTEAIDAARRAAEVGSADAMFNLSLWAHSGVGGARDLPAAREWARRSKERGFRDVGRVDRWIARLDSLIASAGMPAAAAQSGLQRGASGQTNVAGADRRISCIVRGTVELTNGAGEPLPSRSFVGTMHIRIPLRGNDATFTANWTGNQRPPERGTLRRVSETQLQGYGNANASDGSVKDDWNVDVDLQTMRIEGDRMVQRFFQQVGSTRLRGRWVNDIQFAGSCNDDE